MIQDTWTTTSSVLYGEVFQALQITMNATEAALFTKEGDKIGMENCFYILSLTTGTITSVIYFLLFKTISNHLSIDGVRITILKYICAYDISHIVLQLVTIYMYNHWRHSVALTVVRFVLYTTFLTTVSLNPLLTINQYLFIRYGLHYHNIIAMTNITMAVRIYILIINILHVVSFVLSCQRFMFAMLLVSVSLVMLMLTSAILWQANKNRPENHYQCNQAPVKKNNKWKKYVTRTLFFLTLSLSLLRLIFSIKHSGGKINHVCIKVTVSLACTYLVLTPLINVWMNADIKKFFIKDVKRAKERFALWYVAVPTTTSSHHHSSNNDKEENSERMKVSKTEESIVE